MAQRIQAILERVQRKIGAVVDRQELSKICEFLARVIDQALATQQTLPLSPQELVTLLKQIFSKRNDRAIRPAMLALMVSFKGAFHAGWFILTEGAGELLTMTNELLDPGPNKIRSNSCSGFASSEFGVLENGVNELLQRLYPWLKVEKILLSGELESGYKTLLCDFYLPFPTREGEVRLFTFKKDQMESSACLIPPKFVNFLVNGQGIEKRTSMTVDAAAAQPPANCTMLVKVGINLLQIVGDFQATYIVIVGIARNVPLKLGGIPEAQPLDSHVDDDLMEGPSKVSLSCPISRTRISIPVRGRACKHHQCFDIKNYLEINQKRPSWRCPLCNLHISWKDLRLDKKMAELLRLDENVMDVVLAKDGSWEPAPSADTVISLSKRSVQNPVVIDLSQDGDEDSPQQHGKENFSTPVACAVSYITTESEDVKPDITRPVPTNPAASVAPFPGVVPTAGLPNLDHFYQQQQRVALCIATQNVDLGRIFAQPPVPQQRQQASQHQPSAPQQEVPPLVQRQQQQHAHQRQFSIPLQSQLQQFTVSQNQAQQVPHYHLSAPRQSPLTGTTQQQHLSMSRAFPASQLQSQQNVLAARSFPTPTVLLSSPQPRAQQQQPQQHVQQHLSALSSPQAQAQAQAHQAQVHQQLPSFRPQFSRSLSAAQAQVQQLSAARQVQLSRSLSQPQAPVGSLSSPPTSGSGPQQHSRLSSPPGAQSPQAAQIQQQLLPHQLNQQQLSQLHALRQQQLREMVVNNSWDAAASQIQTPPQYDPRFWQTTMFMNNGGRAGVPLRAPAPPRPTGQGPSSDSPFDISI